MQLSLTSTTVRPGKVDILDIDDTFCAAHGSQQLAFWNAHHDERGFAPMNIYHVASGTPVVAILRSARTAKGTEVRCVLKHVTKRLRSPNEFAFAAVAARRSLSKSARWLVERLEHQSRRCN